MKRFGFLFDKIVDMNNLIDAHKNAKRGKRFYKEVKMVDSNLEFYLKHIQKILIEKSYKVSEYKIFEKNENGKMRIIHKLPYFPDRIIQWAVLKILEPIFISSFIKDTYSSIPGRGIHKIVIDLKKYLNSVYGEVYCLKIDIKKFYENVDHKILKQMLRRKIKDRDVLDLLDKIIDSLPGEKGIPIGNYTSQYFANFYLTYFDHFIKEALKIKKFYRYMDDMILLSDNKESLHKNLAEIRKYLRDNLKLEIKKNYQIFPVSKRGIDFVGYRFFKKHILLRKNICKRFKRAFFSKKNKNLSLNSYIGWLKWCNSFNLLKKYKIIL